MLMTVVISSAASTLKVNEKIVRKSISMLVFLAITVITILPIYATSSNWGFSMNWDGRYVNGANNGVYHSLEKGGVQLSGTIENTYSRPGALGPYKVYIELLNKTSGNSFGEISVIPKADALKYFSGTFSSVGGGTKYYLVAYRTESDGRRIEADGTLKNI